MRVMHQFPLIFATSTALLFGQGLVEKQVMEADQDWAQATTKGDSAALDRILHEELIYIHSNGEADTKAQFMDNIKTGKRRYESIDLKNPRVRVFGSAAVVTSTAAIKTSMQGKAGPPANLAFLHTYIKDKGRWRMVAHQSTRLPN